MLLKGSFVVYILPLACMLLGAALSASAFPARQDLAGALGALAGFALGFALVRWPAWVPRQDCHLQPTLVEVVQRTTEPVRLA